MDEYRDMIIIGFSLSALCSLLSALSAGCPCARANGGGVRALSFAPLPRAAREVSLSPPLLFSFPHLLPLAPSTKRCILAPRHFGIRLRLPSPAHTPQSTTVVPVPWAFPPRNSRLLAACLSALNFMRPCQRRPPLKSSCSLPFIRGAPTFATACDAESTRASSMSKFAASWKCHFKGP